MARSARRTLARQYADVPGIVASIDAITNVGQRRHARLRLREDVLGYRLLAKRWKLLERVADNIAKFVGGSLLTTTAALLLSGHGEATSKVVGGAALLLLVIGTIFASAFEYLAAAWDSEADRIEAAMAELVRGAT